MFQQPTRKDSNIQVRCLQPLIRTSYATGHDSLELTGAFSPSKTRQTNLMRVPFTPSGAIVRIKRLRVRTSKNGPMVWEGVIPITSSPQKVSHHARAA